MNEKNFIEIEYRRPLVYTAKSPVEVLSREKEKIDAQIEDSITRLTSVYENGISQVQAPIWRIYGVEKIINKEIEIIQRSKKKINMRIGFLFENEAEILLKEFKKRKNLEVKILASHHATSTTKSLKSSNSSRKTGLKYTMQTFHSSS